MNAAQFIQYSVTPAVMISSAALLLLGLNNKFSSLFSRFRLLNQERRHLAQNTERGALDSERLGNLEGQLHRLYTRMRRVKNAILMSHAAILCFLLTSGSLFASRYVKFSLEGWVEILFSAGMGFLALAMIYMIRETCLAFHILELERKS